jgi:pilus assembly protein TadC
MTVLERCAGAVRSATACGAGVAMNPSLAVLALAVLGLAVATLLGPGRFGCARLYALTAPPVAHTLPAVRPLAVLIAAAATTGLVWAATGSVAGGLVSGAAGAGLGVAAHRQAGRRSQPDDEPADLAAAWTQLAVCLQVGLPVAAALTAATEPLTGRTGAQLRRVVGLLELGADPAQAWAAARENPALAGFARAAVRSAGTGAALARVAHAEATRLQAALVDVAEARSQRAAVLITAPLGLCFLPAFLVLGIAPVVIGLADHALSRW